MIAATLLSTFLVAASQAQPIRKQMSGDLEFAFLAVLDCARRPAVFFAERAYRAMDVGLGNLNYVGRLWHSTLTRVLSLKPISRASARMSAPLSASLFLGMVDSPSGRGRE
jgi:hypothetical protein